ncbi:MAG TPA: hypothetical protein VJ974_01890 [Geopsychrobacteraceae bacterium]|nr:hypothetical protein [Geopsychrobacteraceae bacterium]
MILFEVLRKRGRFGPILERTWKRIGTDIPYPPVTEQNPAQRLIYFGMIAYALVYESALAAGMSTSAAHYLARMQIGKYNLDKASTSVVEGFFSGCETKDEQAYADFFLTRMGTIIKMVESGEGDIDLVMNELAQTFKSPET